jgi:hypothetical protein
MSSIALADLRQGVRHGDTTAREYEDDGEYEEAGVDECVQLAQEAPELVRVDMTIAKRYVGQVVVAAHGADALSTWTSQLCSPSSCNLCTFSELAMQSAVQGSLYQHHPQPQG